MNPNGNIRETIHFYLVDCQTPVGKAIDIFIIALNMLVCSLYVIETYPLTPPTAQLVTDLEFLALLFLLVEFLARVYAAPHRVKYFFSLYSLIDLMAILPVLSWLVLPTLGVSLDFRFISTIRVLNVFRIFRFLRFTVNTEFFFGRIQTTALRLMRLILTIFIIFFVSSGLFFHVENSINPEVQNFGDAFYYSVITLTTVGFGDITPKSSAGRLVTVLMVLSGIILIPWQATQVGREWVRLAVKKDVICPNCGLRFHDPDASHCKACGHVIFQEYAGE